MVAPSKVKDAEVIRVTEHIFGVNFASNSEIKAFLQAEPQSPDSQELQEASGSVATTPSHPLQHTPAAVQQEKDELYCILLTDIYASTHNLAEEEPPLGLFSSLFREISVNKIECHIQVPSTANIGQECQPRAEPIH